MELVKREYGLELQEENIGASIVGTVVDYMTRYMDGDSLEEAFRISLLGADKINEKQKAKELLKKEGLHHSVIEFDWEDETCKE